MTLEERLNQTIEEKEREIEGLESKLQDANDKLHLISKLWMVHQVSENPNYALHLPVPRLEMRQKKDGHYTIFDYGLVYKHFSEMGTALTFIPMGQTKCSGDYNKELPFRDGVHMRHDSKIFNLKAYLVDTDSGESCPIEDCK